MNWFCRLKICSFVQHFTYFSVVRVETTSHYMNQSICSARLGYCYHVVDWRHTQQPSAVNSPFLLFRLTRISCDSQTSSSASSVCVRPSTTAPVVSVRVCVQWKLCIAFPAWQRVIVALFSFSPRRPHHHCRTHSVFFIVFFFYWVRALLLITCIYKTHCARVSGGADNFGATRKIWRLSAFVSVAFIRWFSFSTRLHIVHIYTDADTQICSPRGPTYLTYAESNKEETIYQKVRSEKVKEKEEKKKSKTDWRSEAENNNSLLSVVWKKRVLHHI